MTKTRTLSPAFPVEQFSLVFSFLSPIGSGDNDDLRVAVTCKGLRDQVEDIAKGSVKNPSELIADVPWTGPRRLDGGLKCSSAVVGRFLLVGVRAECIYVLDVSNSLERAHFLESFDRPNLVASPEGMIVADGKFQGRKGLHFFSLNYQIDGSLLHYAKSWLLKCNVK